MTQYATQNLIGQNVTFTSKNVMDSTVYSGVIQGLINSNVAVGYGDIFSYNAAVQRSDSTVGAVNTLTYFLITLSNGQNTPTTRAFADAWISPGSFSVIDSANIYNFNIYDIPALVTGSGASTQTAAQRVAAIRAVLQAAGFNAVQVTDPAALALTSALGSTTVTTDA